MDEPRSYLFVPGARPDRFAKAAASGADAVILDLEDAVGPNDKDAARDHVTAWFANGGSGVVRINGAETPWFNADLDAVARCDGAVVMAPKADPECVARIAERLPDTQVIALVETVVGLVQLRETAAQSSVRRLAFGNVDFSADARIPGGGALLDPARFELILASRLANLPPPVDGVTIEIGDADVLAADVAHAKAAGFTGKLCIHPNQVAPANVGFSPSEAEIVWAQRVLDAIDAAGGAAAQVDGKMVDRPMISEARRTLLRAQIDETC